MELNRQWRAAAVEAHEAKAEGLKFAADTVEGVIEVLAPIEQPIIRSAVALLRRAAERHDAAAKLGAVA